MDIEDKNDYYGYAIVEIKEWLYNNCAFNFYENIYNLNGKMVFDDPYYWDVEFADTSKYNNRQYSDTNTYDYSNNESYVPKSPTPSERSDNESYVPFSLAIPVNFYLGLASEGVVYFAQVETRKTFTDHLDGFSDLVDSNTKDSFGFFKIGARIPMRNLTGNDCL